MRTDDTIVAISSAIGSSAARIIVRLSGPRARKIASEICKELPISQTASLRRLRFRKSLTAPAYVYSFTTPRSATGEDVIEFHIPGNVLLARMLLDELIAHGARQADPGEFTARAFFNGRIDLTQAEGIAATIGAHSEADLAAARRLMSGELARRLAPSMESLANTLALIEAEIDFSEEPVSFLPAHQVTARITEIESKLQQLLNDSPRMEKLAHEPQIVLAGRPNAGKSTLLNALAGIDRAIVSSVAGTTRDALGATIRLNRGLARLVDVAGLDDRDSVSDETVIDRSMKEAAFRAVETADVLIVVRESIDDRPPIKLPRAPDLAVLTKADLMPSGSGDEMLVSARSGFGLPDLRDRLDHLCFGRSNVDGGASTVALTARHVRAIEEAQQSLASAKEAIDRGAEFIALDLREALDALGSILGQITPDDVLGKIFSTFCIGK